MRRTVRRWAAGWGALAALLAAGCREAQAPPLASLSPAPLPVLPAPGGERTEAPVGGEPVPASAPRWHLEAHGVRVDARTVDLREPGAAARWVAALGGEGLGEVVLVPEGETNLAQVAPLLAALDDARAAVWLLHPEGRVGYRLRLRDEPAFQAWLDTPEPGHVRVIQRGDGFELTTSVGKLRGPDPNGPSVPLRGGRHDVASLRAGLTALRERFPGARDVCFVPSFGMELTQVASALSGAFTPDGTPLFAERCLVYPRPR